jgi:DNA-binding NarL/FixJ family response regulator
MDNIIVKIYKLIDPRNNQIRYIGKTHESLSSRLSKHISYSLRNHRKTHKENWILLLLGLGFRPIIETIEETTISEWEEREKFWISFYNKNNCELTNLTEGGLPAFFKNKKHTTESKNKISQAGRGRTQTDFQKQRASECNKGPKTAQHKINSYISRSILKERESEILNLINNKGKTIPEVAKMFNVGVTTVWRIYNKKLAWQQNDSSKNIRFGASKSKSGYFGVTWRPRNKKWGCSIQSNNKLLFLGLFSDKIEAAKKYNEKALELFKEKAVLNRV